MKSFCIKLSDFLHAVHGNPIKEMSQRCRLSIHNGVYKSALEKGSVHYAVDSKSQFEIASLTAIMFPSFYSQFKKYLNLDVGRVVLLLLGIFSSISSLFLSSQLTSS